MNGIYALMLIVASCLHSASASVITRNKTDLFKQDTTIVFTTNQTIALTELNCPFEKCDNGSSNVYSFSSSRTCWCDRNCVFYGDCCKDAVRYQFKYSSQFQCVKSQNTHVFINSDCPADWKDEYVYDNCVKGIEHLQEAGEDPISSIPVTSLITNVTYANLYCSLCNRDYGTSRMWNLGLLCMKKDGSDLPVHFNEENNNLTYNGVYWVMSAQMDEMEELYDCKLVPQIPEEIRKLQRKCTPVRATCSPEWQNTEIEDRCQSYTALRYHNGNAYKNHYCALCNGLNPAELSCPVLRPRFNFVDDPAFYSFAHLFDFTDTSGNLEVGLVNYCDDTEIYDPFFKKCRKVVSDIIREKGKYSITASNVTAPEISQTEISSHPDFATCKTVVDLDKSEFVFDSGGSIYVPKWNITYPLEEYMGNSSYVTLCSPNFESYSMKFPKTMGWLTIIGSWLSCFCLFFYIILFILLSSMRNLAGYNLFSLCSCLLIANLAFFLSVLGHSYKVECTILASIVYLSYLMSFAWTNIIAFDTWMLLHRTSTKARPSFGMNWKTFLFYVLYSWIFPVLCLAFVLIFQFKAFGESTNGIYPDFGGRICWFNNRLALLLFFAVPVAVFVFISILFFVLSAKELFFMSKSKPKASKNHHSNFKVFLRLFILMGVSWAIGIAAGYFDTPVLWYIYTVVLPFQGVLIFFNCITTKNFQDEFRKRFPTFRLPRTSTTSSSAETVA